eukprot:COSAG01_NODE_134_length_24525_cov_434.185172_7_plen_77_part_00
MGWVAAWRGGGQPRLRGQGAAQVRFLARIVSPPRRAVPGGCGDHTKARLITGAARSVACFWTSFRATRWVLAQILA